MVFPQFLLIRGRSKALKSKFSDSVTISRFLLQFDQRHHSSQIVLYLELIQSPSQNFLKNDYTLQIELKLLEIKPNSLEAKSSSKSNTQSPKNITLHFKTNTPTPLSPCPKISAIPQTARRTKTTARLSKCSHLC